MTRARRFLSGVMIASVLVSTSGCMTLLKPESGTIHVTTTPAGAIVSLDGVELGPSPVSHRVTWNQREGQFVVSAQAGGKSASVDLDKRVNALFVCDCCLFLLGIVPGIIAVAVDYSNDYCPFEPVPGTVELELK